ncbi:MAG: extracellular solute-binding protein, partial [Ferrovibrionaceae bacterium]
MTWTGLTWDHPRGYNALAAAAAADPVIAWSRQPLEGFEAHPIGELCATYDIVVLDHPHIGEAVAEACLQPLDTLFTADEITAWASATIGPCMASYRYGGRYWALPLDAATQVMARRADLVDGPAPQTWDEVAALARRVPVCLSLAGPHAALSLMSIAVALGEPPAARDPERFLSDETARAAFALMTQIDATAPAFTRALNPIGLLAAMAGGNDLALCPLVYGYAELSA